MSEMQVEPAPEAVHANRLRRSPIVAPAAAERAAEAAAPVQAVCEPPAPAPVAVDVAPVAPQDAPPPEPTQRAARRPTAIDALDLALPGVRTAEILAELDRRQRRAKALLAERERVIAAMDEIEAALKAIGD